MFTRVLKGHIALARAVFPAGTPGCSLDAMARQFLWEVGKDYAHGTGHGVGASLCVHEGPQRISKALDGTALCRGMVVSNEPGYYEAGIFGVRIENLLEVVTPNSFSGEGHTSGKNGKHSSDCET
jgi:Xaa-Pro aminopeptidase